jgi:hypothetical protein
MGRVYKLSEEEKDRRLQVLERYDRWSEGSESPSPSSYCAATGTDYPYLTSCMKWRKALKPKMPVAREKAGFVRLGTVDRRGGEPVRMSIGNVSIEVGPASSKEALGIVIAALGAAHVL